MVEWNSEFGQSRIGTPTMQMLHAICLYRSLSLSLSLSSFTDSFQSSMPWCSIAQMRLSCYIVNVVCILAVNNHSLFNFQYVGYARTYVNPKLTPAAAEVLQVSFNVIRLIVFLMFFVFCYRVPFFRQLVSFSWCQKKKAIWRFFCSNFK